jgi:hypothetical protein
MKKTNITCPGCGAGFARIELNAKPSAPQGAYHCPACGQMLEQLPESNFVGYRMTVSPTIKGLGN